MCLNSGYAAGVTVSFQGSLLDQSAEVALGPLTAARRTELGRGAWVDLLPGWMTGSDALFERLTVAVPWRAERRQMYDRVVRVPRLLCYYGVNERLPDPALAAAMDALSRHYGPELGEPLRTAGLCLYRDGQDSVAWHGDRNRLVMTNPLVATVSLGARRRFLLRRRGTGRALHRLEPGHGDLVVMGGACQMAWEHTVPKTAQRVGARMSVTIRHSQPAPGEHWLREPGSPEPGHAW
jgi:alkylated DNA repair dioxygenase AlkB